MEQVIKDEIFEYLDSVFPKISTKEELENTFNDISERVEEQAGSYYLFEYCTPKRDGSGESNLVIQLTHNGLQGAVQTKFSAKGFTGGCE